MKKFIVKSLGCKANYSDGQLMEVGLLGRGYQSTRNEEEADLVVVNSCTVTNEADVQSQKMVRDIARKNPNAKIIYTGCGAEVNPEDALKIQGVGAVIGNQNKDQAAILIDEYFSKASVRPELLGTVANYEELKSRHPMDREWAMPSTGIDEILKLNEESSTFRTRAFIKIQEGCNSFCTYCIIPYGRGPNRSLKISEIVDQIKSLVASGIQEVILTGTNIGDYGMDWSGNLEIDSLIEAILVETPLPRLRVSSLDPTEISDRMIALMEKYSRFCPHFHVSLQHVDSKILKLMKRKYTAEDVEQCLAKLSQMKNKPFVGMDYIAGFPGESEEDFLESVERLKKLYWSRIHVFPYSERSGTPATRLPNSVPVSIRKQRAKVIAALSLERLTSVYSESRAAFESAETGLLRGVLLESRVKGPDGSRNWVSGYAPGYQRVILPVDDTAVLRNKVVDVSVERWMVDRASGEVSWLGKGIQ